MEIWTPEPNDPCVWYTNAAGQPEMLPLDCTELIGINMAICRQLYGRDFNPHELAQMRAMSQLDLLNLTAANEKLLYRVKRRMVDPATIGKN